MLNNFAYVHWTTVVVDLVVHGPNERRGAIGTQVSSIVELRCWISIWLCKGKHWIHIRTWLGPVGIAGELSKLRSMSVKGWGATMVYEVDGVWQTDEEVVLGEFDWLLGVSEPRSDSEIDREESGYTEDQLENFEIGLLTGFLFAKKDFPVGSSVNT